MALLVKDLMDTDVETIELKSSVAKAIQIMTDKKVGSLVILDDGVPTGIITREDVLQVYLKAFTRKKPLNSIPITAAGSAPLVTVAPNKSIEHAAEIMRKNRISRLPVMDHLELLGMVTTSNIAINISEVRKKVAKLHEQQGKWKL